jgi:hypothetical protein
MIPFMSAGFENFPCLLHLSQAQNPVFLGLGHSSGEVLSFALPYDIKIHSLCASFTPAQDMQVPETVTITPVVTLYQDDGTNVSQFSTVPGARVEADESNAGRVDDLDVLINAGTLLAIGAYVQVDGIEAEAVTSLSFNISGGIALEIL